jgi:hypothetical protein
VAAHSRGELAAGTRFQVFLPTPAAVIFSFVAQPDAMQVLPDHDRAYFEPLQQLKRDSNLELLHAGSVAL